MIPVRRGNRDTLEIVSHIFQSKLMLPCHRLVLACFAFLSVMRALSASMFVFSLNLLIDSFGRL